MNGLQLANQLQENPEQLLAEQKKDALKRTTVHRVEKQKQQIIEQNQMFLNQPSINQ